MKIVKNMGAQGDCILRRVDKMPDGVKEVPRVDGKIVIAYSETHHHHAVDNMHVKAFEVPGNSLVMYLRYENGITETGGADVVHHRAWDTHETLKLLGKPGDIWEVRRQREWVPEGWRRVED
jgi:hypothetical protein